MKVSTKIKSAALVTTLGIATLALFQNCSAGSMPDVNTASSTSEPAAARLPLVLTVASTVTAGLTTVVSVSGGTGAYHFVATGGTVTLDNVLGGYIYTAPASAGTFIITVTDDAAMTQSSPINVTAAVVTPPPVVTAASKPIYEFLDPSWNTHSYSDNIAYAQGGSSTPKYHLLADSSTGGVPFYRCTLVNRGNVITYFDTRRADCEGQNTQAVQIGFIYADSSHANTVPLYRYAVVVLGWYLDHYDSLSASPPAAPTYSVGGNDPSLVSGIVSAQWQPDGPMGYVPSN